MSSKEEDIKKVSKAAGGDVASFGKLFEMYFKPVYRFIFFKVGSKETAEDLASLTFEKAWKGLAGFDGRNSFKTWLYAIAKNTVIDYYRSKKNSFSIEELEDVFQSPEDVARETEIKDDTKRLLHSVNKLKSEWRKIVEFKYIFELSNEEISYMTGLSDGNIRVILTRALKKLKQIFKYEKSKYI